MNKTIGNIGLIIVCLTAIVYWIYRGWNNDTINTPSDNKTKDTDIPIIDNSETDTTLELIKDPNTIILEIVDTNKTITDALTEEEQIIEDIINSTTENQEEEELGEITYTLVERQTFRQATVKLKAKLAKDGYDYNKVKMDHVFFVIDSGSTKLNWNTAVKKYLDKKQPKDGDYFLMKKFFY